MRHLCVALLLAANPALAQGSREKNLDPELLSAANVRLANPRASRAVSSAVVGAARRLEEPKCRRLFSEFKDQSGRTLARHLETLGQTAASYLGFVLFYDGTGQAACQRRRVVAVTAVGSRVVLVCRQFVDLQHSDPTFAEAIIIHETLHSLGLLEGSLSTADITARVREFCGD